MVSDSTERYISAAVPSLVYLTSLWILDRSIYFLSAGSFTIAKRTNDVTKFYTPS